ncbi:PREDICTED: X-linked retinitis pigmentosa GTPase regulator [Chrysochloris asiatica]|uniref:X-linked retinitis pigmentosa GTPase regulator n=1 Tax=Chrysochloris asiatica TaxID=185453 RepID=A0A9B0WNP9_CHRAS|nr:PREDICTED: X-linked retinitis pigmentosa GTPase regulator [Chrysochloris asiatica]
MEEPEIVVPESGAIFTFGKSKFAENIPSKFWFRNDVPVYISCGDEHTAVITGNNKLYMFGSNNWGQLGLGSKSTIYKPTCVKALKPEKVKLAACGRNHTLVSTEGGHVYAAGGNNEGQLGLGDIEERNSFHLISFFTSQHKIKQLSAGSNTSAALTEDGELFMWGDNSEGQIGLNKMANVCVPHQVTVGKPISWISCGYYHSAFVTMEGKLYTFGEPEFGKLGLPSEQLANHRTPQLVVGISEKVIQVACGGEHTVVLTEKAVYTFGLGQFGQLGLGTYIFEASEPTVIEPVKDLKIRYVSCGENHAALVTETGHIYTFGDGRHGKLGLGHENFTNHFIPTLCSNFLKFKIQLVSCGGCHMLIFAIPQPGMSEEIDTDEMNDSYLTLRTGLPTRKLASGCTLHRMLSARVRRRERGKSPDSQMSTLTPVEENSEACHSFSHRSIPFQLSSSNLLGRPVSGMACSIGLDYQYTVTQEKNIDSASLTDSETLGDTTDILNVTHVMSLSSINKSLKLSPLQKQKKQETVERLKKHAAHTGNDGRNESESEEIFQQMKEGKAYKQCLPQQILVMPCTMNIDEDLDTGSGQSGPQANTGEESLFKERFRYGRKPHPFCEDDGKENDSEETASKKENELTETIELQDLKQIENTNNTCTFLESLGNSNLNFEDEKGKRRKQCVVIDSEGESSEGDSQQGGELFQSTEFSNGEEEDFELKNDSQLWCSRKFIEQENEREAENKASTLVRKLSVQCKRSSKISKEQGVDDSDGSTLEEEDIEAHKEDKIRGKRQAEADMSGDGDEVSEGKGKPGDEAGKVANSEGDGSCKRGNSTAEQVLSEERAEEEDKGVIVREIKSLSQRTKDLENKTEWEKMGSKGGHLEKGEWDEEGDGEGEEEEQGEEESEGEGEEEEEGEESNEWKEGEEEEAEGGKEERKEEEESERDWERWKGGEEEEKENREEEGKYQDTGDEEKEGQEGQGEGEAKKDESSEESESEEKDEEIDNENLENEKKTLEDDDIVSADTEKPSDGNNETEEIEKTTDDSKKICAKEEKSNGEERSICEYNENPKGNMKFRPENYFWEMKEANGSMCDDSKVTKRYLMEKYASENIHFRNQIKDKNDETSPTNSYNLRNSHSLFKRMSLTSHKNNHKPLPETGDQLTFKGTKKETNQNQMKQHLKSASAVNGDRRSKSCSIL